jgi:hypothetical protein
MPIHGTGLVVYENPTETFILVLERIVVLIFPDTAALQEGFRTWRKRH